MTIAVFFIFLLSTPSSMANVFDQENAAYYDGAIARYLDRYLNGEGYIKNETAYRFSEPRSFTKIRNMIYLKGSIPIGNHIKITSTGTAYHDHVYDLFEYDTIAARSERDSDKPLRFVETLAEQKDSDVIDIKEIFVDFKSEHADLRLGKQIIVWGVLTGIRIVDEINPQDFRELILPDLLDYRVPLWSAKLNLYNPIFDTELIWIPDVRGHKPAPSGSEWELLQEVPGTEYPSSRDWRKWEIGGKIETEIFRIKLTLNYFNTRDDFPTIFRHVKLLDLEDQTEENQEDPIYSPRYTRMQMYGGTFSRQLWGQVFKGEAAYVTNKYFGLNDIDRNNDGYLDHQGELKRNHLRMGFGIDFHAWDTDFSPGISQWYIFNYDHAILQDRLDSALNLFLRKKIKSRQVNFELLAIYLINLKETYIKPKFIIDMTSHFQLTTGMDLFYGEKSKAGVINPGGRVSDFIRVEQQSQFIGNFNDNKRVFIEFKYNF